MEKNKKMVMYRLAMKTLDLLIDTSNAEEDVSLILRQYNELLDGWDLDLPKAYLRKDDTSYWGVDSTRFELRDREGSTVEINGEEVELREPEQIHTYARWKSMGFQVRRGEKAVAKFKVWKHVNGKKKDDDGEEKTAEAERGKMFLKQAAFFSVAQVDPIG